MNVSELIATLEKYRREHGDHEIQFSNESEGTSLVLDKVAPVEDREFENGRVSRVSVVCDVTFR